MSTFQSTPSRKLPPNPSLKSLKNQAKQLLKAHRAGDFDACCRFQKSLPRFSGLPEAVIQTEKIALADAQAVIAREYGFESWPKMKAHIGSLTVADAGVSQYQRIVDAIARGETETLKTLLEGNPALRRQIQESSQVKSLILAGIYRELSAPVTAIKGDVDDLLLGGISEHLSERQLDNLKKVQQTADRLAGVLHKIEDLDRASRSRFQAAVEALTSGDAETLNALLERYPKVKQELQEAVEGKSVYPTQLSHEMRTPMNAIIGFTRLILRRDGDRLPDRQKNILGRIWENADGLLGLINDLLDLSMIDARRMDVEVKRFSVDTLMRSCCAEVQPLVTEKPGVKLACDVGDGLDQTETDEGRVRQIVTNLLSNAIKFTEQGQVTVRAHREADDIVIAVSDTSVGMPQDALATIFKEFQQVEGSATARKSTGLGLPITKRIAELLGGSIEAESEAGKGTTFTLKVPVVYQIV